MQNKVEKHEKHIHEPWIQIAKRNSIEWYKSWAFRIASFAVALLVCSVVIILLTKYNPIEVYSAIIYGSFGTERKIWYLFQEIAMLLCVSLAVTPAFKMRFWNIGAEGQTLIGALTASACMIYFGDKLPTIPMIIVSAILCITSGMLWGVIPAIFKAKYRTNETLFTLMMNYVAIQLVKYFIVFWENPKDSNTVGIINSSTQGGWFPVIGGQKYLLNLIIVGVITIVLYVYLKFSKHGYEISVVGESENTARYVGINVKKVIIRTMALSGALCGIAGLLLVSGTHHTITTDTAGGMGFTAIMVSWLAKFNPIVMILTTFIIVFFERGAGEIAMTFQLNESVADILTGIIIFFITGSEFFVNYKLSFRKKHKEEK